MRFVWFVTGLSLVSYGILLLDYYCWRPDSHEGVLVGGFARHVIFCRRAVVLGAIVSYLVERVRSVEQLLRPGNLGWPAL